MQNEILEKEFTGAIERKQTPDDVMLGSFTSITTRPTIYMPNFNGTIEGQAQTPSCGAHMGQAIKQVLEGYRGSPEYLWKKIKQIDQIAPENGTNMLYVMQVLHKTGITSIDLMPNNANVPVTDYTDPKTITPEMDAEAIKHIIGPYAFKFNPTIEELKQAIYDHKAVAMLLRIGPEWWKKADGVTSSWAEQDILPLRTNLPITSGHFVTAYAYDEQYIYFINEWTTQWGRVGIGYFGEDYMQRCVEIGTTVNLDAVKYVFTQTLKQGSKGPDVRMLQHVLNDQGYAISVDGIFGRYTKFAVIRFQAKHGLAQDGVVGPKTNEVLNSL